MKAPTVSIVIVSRGRPGSLLWCLTGIAGLRYDPFEVVVVADPQGVAAVRNAGLSDRLKLIEFDEANISAARNVGIAHSAGDIIAFIDDDAVPEPTWLLFLTQPFEHPDIAAVGGFVRGRNGISFQWKARRVDAAGRAFDLPVDETRWTVPNPPPDQAVKTEGTNMAVRREVLENLGGFDPNFRFYLDETDLNLRLFHAGYRTAIAPMAQVHHAYAPSARRRGNRAVRSLFEIGASTAVFLRKHCPKTAHETRFAEVIAEQRARLVGQMVDGMLEPGDIATVLATLTEGFNAGHLRSREVERLQFNTDHGFKPFPGTSKPGEVMAGRIWSRRRLRREAEDRVAKGYPVTLILLSPTRLSHRVRFTKTGVWEQAGGLFGRSLRSDPKFRFTHFQARIRREKDRIRVVRGLN